MEKINTEILVSSLFVTGFDQVDSILFTYTLGKLAIENRELKLFEYKENMFSNTFNKYVTFDGNVYKLKEGYALDTNISENNSYQIPLQRSLNTNQVLIDYLNNFDFKEIVARKVSEMGYEQKEHLFSTKEKEIINEINNQKPKIKSKK